MSNQVFLGQIIKIATNAGILGTNIALSGIGGETYPQAANTPRFHPNSNFPDSQRNHIASKSPDK
jgi:hypothetical protein